jgi:hypothetical protein
LPTAGSGGLGLRASSNPSVTWLLQVQGVLRNVRGLNMCACVYRHSPLSDSSRCRVLVLSNTSLSRILRTLHSWRTLPTPHPSCPHLTLLVNCFPLSLRTRRRYSAPPDPPRRAGWPVCSGLRAPSPFFFLSHSLSLIHSLPRPPFPCMCSNGKGTSFRMQQVRLSDGKDLSGLLLHATLKRKRSFTLDVGGETIACASSSPPPLHSQSLLPPRALSSPPSPPPPTPLLSCPPSPAPNLSSAPPPSFAAG